MLQAIKKFGCIFMGIAMLCSIVGCAASPPGSTADNAPAGSSVASAVSSEANGTPGEKVVLKLPTCQIGKDMSAPWFYEMLNLFNEQYGDTIELQVEEIPNAQSLFDKIQVLMSANDMPDLTIETGRNILEEAITAGQAVDLTPYIDADPEWKASLDPDAVKQNSRDGRIYGVPVSKMTIGYYYNKDLFAKAGVDGPAKTWDEFFEICDKLKAAGIAPLSMDTLDEGWITTLLLGSMIGTDGAEGNEFMNTQYPENYQVPVFIRNVERIQKCFQEYTTSDAIGGKYENGAANFFAEETAMIFNGSWMIGNFYDPTVVSEGFDKKIDVAAYPENGMYSAPRYGWFCSSKTPEKIDAAVTFLKFITGSHSMVRAFELYGAIPASSVLEIPAESAQKQPMAAKLIEFTNNATYKYGPYDVLWYTPVRSALNVQYPALANGDITPEEFAIALNEAAKTAS